MSDLTLTYAGQPVDLQALMRHITQHPVSAHYSPWFSTYFADLAGEDYLSRYVRFLRGFLAIRPGGVQDQKVLDAGCGFGIMATLMALMGAREVQGLDCHAGMIETFSTYLEILPWQLPVHPQQGDVGNMPYADASFDLVISHEAISHYPDVPAFLREAYRVLRPGGALLLSDSNNALNSRVRRETYEIWHAFEMGPAGAHVHGHTIEKPFVEQRAMLIGEAFPDVAPKEITTLAKLTSGLAGEALLAAVRRYRETGALPEHPYQEGQCPIDPVQGYYIEYLFDPYALAHDLQHLGFKTRLRAYLGGARGGPLAVANKVLTWAPFTPVVLPLAKSFRLLATKKGA